MAIAVMPERGDDDELDDPTIARVALVALAIIVGLVIYSLLDAYVF